VENFNYVGSILNEDNKINTEIAEKIAKGNKAHYANSKLIKQCKHCSQVQKRNGLITGKQWTCI
jgi:hypothetical protein